MPLKDTLKNYIAKRLFGYGPIEDWSYVDQMSGPAKDIKLLGMYSGITYRCINTIAEAVGGKYIPVLYTTDNNGQKKTVAKHPLLTLLQNPNPDLSMYQLFEGSASFVEQFGEFFWYMVPGAVTGYGLNGPKQIYLLRPDRMGITLDKKTGEVIGYTYNAGSNNSRIPFEPEEIIHHMTFNPKNPYRGYSTVEAAVDYIQTEEEVSRFTRNYFRNNAAMTGVLNVAGKMPRENWQKFTRQWREKYEGVNNAGKVALVRDSQVTFTPIGTSIGEMQMTDLKQTTVEQIMMMFQIPKGIFGMEDGNGLGRASVETLEYIFAKWTINNKLSRLDDTLQRALDRYFPKSGLLVSHENIIPEDKEFELSRYSQGVDKWLTRAEIRSQDPLTANTPVKGDDQLFAALQQIPLSDAASYTTPSTSSTSSIKIVKAKKKAFNYTAKQKEAFRLSIQANATAYARRYKQAFVTAIDKQKQTALGNIQHLTGKALGEDLFDMSSEDQNINDNVMPVLSALAVEQGSLALQFSGDTEGTYSLSNSVMNAIQSHTKKMSQNFNQQTLDDLNQSLAEGITAGEGEALLTKRVEDVYAEAEGYRAERIARTESQYASNSATVDAYQQNPVVTGMQWFANPDACIFCDDLDGKIVSVDDIFAAQGTSIDVTDEEGIVASYNLDYEDVGNPPLHPNCECTIVPVTLSDASASAKPRIPKDTITVSKSEYKETQEYISELERLAGISNAKSE